jgi:hypothetical protein
MQVFLTTTGVQTNIIINDLGKALFVHPKIGIPLIEPVGEFTLKDISTSTSLIAAVTSGFIILTNIDGTNITSLTDITNKENDHGNQTGLLDDDHTQYLNNIRGDLRYPSRTLTSANVYVGNASNVATPVSISGDATLSNTGALTLSNVGTAGTYKSVTTDSKGRVIAGTNPTTLQYFNATGVTTTVTTFAVVTGMSLTTTATSITTYLLKATLNIRHSTTNATVIEIQVFVNGVADPDTLINYSMSSSTTPIFIPINKSFTASPVGAVYDIRWRRVSGTAIPTVTNKSLILQEII